VSLDTGWIGDFKGFASYSHAEADKWRGAGRDDKYHTDGYLLYQLRPHSSVGLTWAYNDGFDNSYRSYTDSTFFPSISALQAFNSIGRKFDYDTFWGTPGYAVVLSGPSAGPNPKTFVTNPEFPTTNTTNVTNAYSLNLNPFRNVVATLPVHIQLSDNLRWDTNGYLWWGSGGGSFGTTLTEGGAVNGYTVPVEYGDPAGTKNTILAYESSVTRTFRPGVTSKVVYDLDNYTFSFGGWMEHAEHRQTEPFSVVNTNATPCDPWLVNLNASNQCVIRGASGIGGSGPLEGRDFLTSSVGQAVFGEAQGRFFDDALKITAGISYRDIHRSMYDYLPTCAVNASAANCSAITPAFFASTTWTQSSAYQFFNAAKVGNAAAYAAMQAYAANPHANFSGVLPEFSATYDIDPFQQLFADASTGYRTPSNFVFNTFNSSSSPTLLEITNVKSEFTWSYEAGYRFHGDFLTASGTVWLQDVSDYQASVQLDPQDYTTSNIGGVKIYGIDAEAGTKPWHGFTFYASAELENSVLANNVAASSSGGVVQYVASKGKQLVDTPNWIVSTTVGYENEGFFASVTPHCYGERATALLNDEFIPANCTLDASAGYKLDEGWGSLKDAKLEFYALNAFDSSYLGEVTTQGQTNAKPAISTTGVAIPIQSYSAKPGAPLFLGVRLVVNLGH